MRKRGEVVAADRGAILGTPPSWLGSPLLAYLGTRSYGLYLWHYPIVRVFRDSGASWQESAVASLLGGLILAALSFHTIEAWVRRRTTASERVSLGAGP